MKTCLSFFVLILLHSSSSGQYFFYHIGDSLTVAAASGISLRESASANANKILVIPFGQKVVAKSSPLNRETIEHRPGNWVEVEYNKKVGFVFSGYLTQLKIPDLPDINDKRILQHPCYNFSWFEDVARLNADSLLVQHENTYFGFDTDKDQSVSQWEIFEDETELYHLYSYERHYLVIESQKISMVDVLNLLEYITRKFQKECWFIWHNIGENEQLPIRVDGNNWQIQRISCQNPEITAEQSLNKVQIRIFIEGS